MVPYMEKNCSNNLSPKDRFSDNNSESGVERVSDSMDNRSAIQGEDLDNVKTYSAGRTFTTRREEAAAIRQKFPTKIPIIVDRFHKESSLPQLKRSKFLVPQEITMSQFATIIRNRMKLGANQAFYLLVNNRSMLSLSRTVAEIYRDHKEKDGFLYMTYASQEIFG